MKSATFKIEGGRETSGSENVVHVDLHIEVTDSDAIYAWYVNAIDGTARRGGDIPDDLTGMVMESAMRCLGEIVPGLNIFSAGAHRGTDRTEADSIEEAIDFLECYGDEYAPAIAAMKAMIER